MRYLWGAGIQLGFLVFPWDTIASARLAKAYAVAEYIGEVP
jgi:hypothetical protein